MLLSVANVAKSFGADHILTGVTFRLDAREKVALVGRNGTGKTTLLKILTGQMEPDTGHVGLTRGAKVGYLRQEAPVTIGRTVIEEAESAREGQLAMRNRLEELERKLNPGSADVPSVPDALATSAEDLEEYALLHEHFLDNEGYSAETDVRAVLARMGFTEDEFEKPTDSLSGGEKTRLAIGRLLLEEPDLLVLDEPTNHLDLQATEWLEGWIRGYHGAVLLVSHDRAFLESTAERVLEMREGTVKAYPGPFEKYLRLRAEEEARQAEVAKRQEAEIAKLDEYVRRFMNSQRTAQARGRQKIMNRLIESKVEAPKADKGMKAGFGSAKRSGDIAMIAEKLTVGFEEGVGNTLPNAQRPTPNAPLFSDLDWTVRYGERWGIVGENGSGKSTLVKVMLGLMEPLAGRGRLGAGVTAGYFSQDNSDLDPEMSPIDFLVYDADMLPAEARNLLARFLITGDDVYRPIRTLSGGEKNKLSLARLTRLNPNLLILDEPTNHLDMASRDALAEVLGEYKGALVLVSHDRYLLARVTDHTLDVRRSGPLTYSGSYADYRARQNSAPKTPPKPVPTIPKLLGKEKPEEPTLSPRELSKEIERMERLVADTEDQVGSNEQRIKEIEEELADLPPTADVFAMTREHARMQEQLEGSLSAWEEHSTRLEALKARQREGVGR